MTVAVTTPWWQKPASPDPPPPPEPQALTTVQMGEQRLPLERFFSPNSPWRRPITDWTPYDDPFLHTAPADGSWTPIPATKTVSRAWVEWICNGMQLDPTTGLLKPGGSKSYCWISTSNPIYEVPGDYPLRPMSMDAEGYKVVGGHELDAVLKQGVPIPDDALTENHWGVSTAKGQPPVASGEYAVEVWDGDSLIGTTDALPYNAGTAAMTAALTAVLTGGYAGALWKVAGLTTATAAGLEVWFHPEAANGHLRLAVQPMTTTPPMTTKQHGDRWVNIVQPDTDSVWELFRVTRSAPGGPLDLVGWGGAIRGRLSTHMATYRNVTVNGFVEERSTWGGNATSMANVPWLDADILAECQATDSVYPSAIPWSIGNGQYSPVRFVWPATRGDGTFGRRPDAIPEGARVSFPPGPDWDNWLATKVPAEFRPIARAAQLYGIIPRDKTGGGYNLQLRSYSIIGSAKNWKDVLPLYITDPGNAAFRYATMIPWHLAVIVSPDQSR